MWVFGSTNIDCLEKSESVLSCKVSKKIIETYNEISCFVNVSFFVLFKDSSETKRYVYIEEA